MALKKAEMEQHAYLYEQCMQSANEAEQCGLYKVAICAAIEAWQYVDGMLQYAKRYQDREFKSVPAVDFVLRYAPLLLDRSALTQVNNFLDTCKRIHRQTSEDIPSKLENAEERLMANHRLWSVIEHSGEVMQDRLRELLGGDQDYWRGVAQAWEKMGLLSRMPLGTSYMLRLATRMGEVISAKCPSCGHVDKAPKGMFLEIIACPTCHRKVLFVLMLRAQSRMSEG